jgi:predicted GNAT family acetyltransferase
MLIHNKAQKRFEWHEKNEMSFVDYTIANGRYMLCHCEVPMAFRGNGIGRNMVLAVFAYLKEHKIKASPQCSYILHLAMRNPEYKEVFSADNAASYK